MADFVNNIIANNKLDYKIYFVNIFKEIELLSKHMNNVLF